MALVTQAVSNTSAVNSTPVAFISDAGNFFQRLNSSGNTTSATAIQTLRELAPPGYGLNVLHNISPQHARALYDAVTDNARAHVEEVNQQLADRSTCLGFIDSLRAVARHILPQTTPAPPGFATLQRDRFLQRVDDCMYLFRRECQGRKNPVSGSMPEMLHHSIRGMTDYVEQARNECARDYNQKLKTEASVTIHSPQIVGQLNGSSSFRADVDVIAANAVARKLPEVKDDLHLLSRAEEKNRHATAVASELNTLENCVLQNDLRLQHLRKIYQLTLPTRSPLADFAIWLYNLLRGR